MKIRTLMPVLLIALLLPALAAADVCIKQATHQDGFSMGGQTMAERNDTTVVWLSKVAARSETSEGTFIVRTDKDTLYILNDKKKEYSAIALSAMGVIDKMFPGDDAESKKMKEQMNAMAGMMTIKATVTATEETKEVKGYKCTKYDILFNMGMFQIKTVNWATKDVDIDWAVYRKAAFAPMAIMPGGQSVITELKKLDGLPVMTEGSMNMMGNDVKMTSELISVTKGDAPKGAFDIPEGYKKVAFAMEMGM